MTNGSRQAERTFGLGWLVATAAWGGLSVVAGFGFDAVVRPAQLRLLAEFGTALPALTDAALNGHFVVGLSAVPLALAVVALAARWKEPGQAAVLVLGVVWTLALAGGVALALQLPYQHLRQGLGAP